MQQDGMSVLCAWSTEIATRFCVVVENTSQPFDLSVAVQDKVETVRVWFVSEKVAVRAPMVIL